MTSSAAASADTAWAISSDIHGAKGTCFSETSFVPCLMPWSQWFMLPGAFHCMSSLAKGSHELTLPLAGASTSKHPSYFFGARD